MELGELGEFGFLKLVREWAGAHVGDDAAVLPGTGGRSLVVTSDVLLQDTHFRLDWSSASDIGWKAVAVNVSDIAAMGAEPQWITVGLGAPPATATAWLADLYAGIAAACEEYGCALVGGDTVRSDGVLLAVTAIGEVDGAPLTRNGARPGDLLAVTGSLGRAAAGVHLLRAARTHISPACVDAHRRPQARVDAGRALRASGAHACMDLSDGLLSDVRRLAAASTVGVEIDADAIPIDEDTRTVADALGLDAFTLAAGGGEDFELLVALERPTPGVTVIGRVVDDGLWLRRGGERVPLPDGGWDHFRATRT